MTGPKRCGTQPYLGLYAGGSDLDINYKPIQDTPFHHVSQLKSGNQMATNQSNLIQASNDMNVIKLNGQLEITSKETVELDKEQFVEAVKKNIQLFGLHTWYYLPGPDITMLDLCEDYHTFTLQEIIDNYYIRAEEPPLEKYSSGDETDA